MNIDLNNFTEKARAAVMGAQQEARDRSHQQIDSWHLLASLVTQEGGLVPAILRKLEISDAAVSLALSRELDRLPAVSGSVDASRIFITDTLNDILSRARRPPSG